MINERRNHTTALPRHIVWDWNGTLQDDVQAAVNGINLLLGQRGMAQVSIGRHRELFSFPVADYYRELGFVLEKENWDEMAHTFITAFAADSSARLFDGTVPALSRFEAAGVPMSILSACQRDVLEEALLSAGIRRFFHTVKGLGDPGAVSKIALAEELFATIDVPAGDVLLVGDTTHDKEVADAAGCRCVLLASGYQSRERLAACGCTVLDSVADVPAFLGIGAV